MGGVVKAITSVFSGGASSSGEAQAKAALALQKQQAAKLDKQRAKEEAEKQASLRAVRAVQGGGRRGQLFAATGETGVKKALGA